VNFIIESRMAVMGGVTALSLLGACAAYLDIRYRRLPNVLSLIVLVSGLGWGLWIGGAAWAVWSLLHAAAALLVAMALFKLDFIGGGDGKFYAAVAAWMPIKFAAVLVLGISLSGLVLVLMWFLFRKRVLANAATGDRAAFAKLPYGVAIAVGGAATLAVIVA
jgi:prepilin peptidase CpaA